MTKRSDISHVAFYFDEWLTGTFELEEGERGTFITLCALIWKTGNRLQDNPDIISRWCGISKRLWTKRRARLLELGKISVEDGFIVQSRAVSEYENATEKRRPLVEAGRKGGRKRAENAAKNERKTRENSPNSERTANEREAKPLTDNDSGSSNIQIQNQKKETSEAKASSAKKVGTRIPDDWQLCEEGRAFAQERGYAPEQITDLAGRFVDHWRGKTGQSATKRDWLGTWRNWVRNDLDWKGPPGERRRPAGQSAYGCEQARMRDELQSELRLGREPEDSCDVPELPGPNELDCQASDRPALRLVAGAG